MSLFNFWNWTFNKAYYKHCAWPHAMKKIPVLVWATGLVEEGPPPLSLQPRLVPFLLLHDALLSLSRFSSSDTPSLICTHSPWRLLPLLGMPFLTFSQAPSLPGDDLSSSFISLESSSLVAYLGEFSLGFSQSQPIFVSFIELIAFCCK